MFHFYMTWYHLTINGYIKVTKENTHHNIRFLLNVVFNHGIAFIPICGNDYEYRESAKELERKQARD